MSLLRKTRGLIRLPRNIPARWLRRFCAAVQCDNDYAVRREWLSRDGRYRVLASALRYGPREVRWFACHSGDRDHWWVAVDTASERHGHRTARPAFAAAIRAMNAVVEVE